MNLTIHDIDQVILRLEEDHKAIEDDIKLNPTQHNHTRLDLRDAERNLETVQTLKQVFLRNQGVPVPRLQIHKTFGLGFGKPTFAAVLIALSFGAAFGTVGAISTLSKCSPQPSLIVSVPPQDAAILEIPTFNNRPMTSF